ncbi:hypothetical protein V2J09_001015 [Rumex salicifolius]
MASSSPTIMFVVVLLLLLVASVPNSSASPTVFEILPLFGLPSGLLPSSVQSYTLDDDGSFVVELSKPCYLHFDYVVYYDKSVTGKLRYGSITELKGIQVHKFFLWLDVDQITVDSPSSDSIYFQVGLINKKLDLDQFKTVRACRDGNEVSSADSFKDFFKLPTPIKEEIPMLLTE